MRFSINALVAFMVMAIGVLLVLGYLSTDVGSHWGTVQGYVAPFIFLIVFGVICVAVAVGRLD